MTFIRRAGLYRRFYLAARFRVTTQRWLPAGIVTAVLLVLYTGNRGAAADVPLIPALLILPSLLAGTVSLFRGNRITDALSWLDSALAGRQELQAAWETRDGSSVFSEPLKRRGEEILAGRVGRLPRPGVSPMGNLMSLALVGGFLFFIIAGPMFRRSPDPDLSDRGAELESWAEVWAEGGGGSAGDEEEELADRMKSLGRRMADGAISEDSAEQSLRKLEEDIIERSDELTRDKLAESLVDDLQLDRENADAFRVGRRRLPADVLADLEGAIGNSPLLSPSDRESLERLLSDDSLRTPGGGGSRELSERLTEALKDVLEPEDPRLDRLDQAVKESRRARNAEPGSADDGKENKAQVSGTDDEKPFPGGESSGDGESGEQPGDTAEQTGVSGGAGRGSVPVEDGSDGTLPPVIGKNDNPLRLPSGGDGSNTWKTVIRAYGDGGGTPPAPDAGEAPPWEKDVESVIGREDIRPGLRDYVRDYFLALEAGSEEQDDERQ